MVLRAGEPAAVPGHSGPAQRLTGAAAEETLDSLLDPRHGLYPRAALNIPGIAAALDLRAGMGFIASPPPPPEKYIDNSYYEAALR